tara:strand:- start:1141 stop:3876 length:2736 start_codon:yes stop_codon:yes gene_type:complete
MSSNAEQNIGAIDPNAFDGQMLLLDMFLGNIPGMKVQEGSDGPGVGAVEDPNGNVPYLPTGFDSVNALAGINRDGTIGAINDFISKLTAVEAAQIYPQIRIQLVDHATGKMFELPIGPVGGLHGRGVSSPLQGPRALYVDRTKHYYVKNEIGLTSLSLNLDGRDLPFFGKSYIVKMGFIMDSINTFTSDVAGTFEKLGYPVSFAQIFRSSGVVGAEKFYTRLGISYSSNDESLIEKYALNSPQMRFNIMMTLTETKFSLEENLKVKLDVSYQSREESLFNSNLVFDFLGLDLLAAEENKRKQLNIAAEQVKILDKEKQAYVDAVREEVRNGSKYKEYQSKYKGVSDKELPNKIATGEFHVNDIIRRQEYIDLNAAITREKLEKTFEDFTDVKALRDQAAERKKNAVDGLANLRHSQLTKALEETFSFSDPQKLKNGVVSTVFFTSQQIYDYYNQTSLTKQVKKNLADSEGTSKQAIAGNTVTIKEKPKDGDKANTTKGKGKDISRYEQDIDNILVDLGRQKQIDYILFGDIMRLVYTRLYKIITTQVKKLGIISLTDFEIEQKLRNSLEKTILLFSDITFESFEDKIKDPANLSLRRKSLYDVPISIKNLRYILAKRLYGQQQNYFTIFQLMEELIQLISLTRKRKAQVLNNQSSVSNFTLKKMTYPLEIDLSVSGGNLPLYKINTNDRLSVNEVFSGMLIYVKRAKDNKAIRGAENLCPKFIFGGTSTGAITKFQINEIADSDLQKLVMEQLRGDDSQVIPSFFEVEISTIMAPFFQLGMQIKVAAPTLDAGGASRANMFIAGDYQVSAVTHEYTTGGLFTTKISATLYNSDKKSILKERGLEAAAGELGASGEAALRSYKKISGVATAKRDVSKIKKQAGFGAFDESLDPDDYQGGSQSMDAYDGFDYG